MKIYTVARDSGQPVPATANRTEWQLYPSWFQDGQSLLYSASEEANSDPALYVVNLKTIQVTRLPETSGLYWGQISPDSHTVVALTEITQKLMLYDMNSHKSSQIAPVADYPRWSRDGKYVYFSTLFWRRPGAGIFRWKTTTHKSERILGLPDFQLGGVWGVWFGVTPNGDPLIVRDLTSTDLYALDMDLP